MALGMIRRARRHGLSFDWVAADGGYGKEPWFLDALDDDGERFLVDVHADRTIYLADPAPRIPERRGRGRTPTRRVAEAAPTRVDHWAAAQPASAWRRMSCATARRGRFWPSSWAVASLSGTARPGRRGTGTCWCDGRSVAAS